MRMIGTLLLFACLRLPNDDEKTFSFEGTSTDGVVYANEVYADEEEEECHLP